MITKINLRWRRICNSNIRRFSSVEQRNGILQSTAPHSGKCAWLIGSSGWQLGQVGIVDSAEVLGARVP